MTARDSDDHTEPHDRTTPDDPGRDETPDPDRGPIGENLLPDDHRDAARDRAEAEGGETDPVLEEAQQARAEEDTARADDPDRPSLSRTGSDDDGDGEDGAGDDGDDQEQDREGGSDAG